MAPTHLSALPRTRKGVFYYYGGKKRLARYYPAPQYTTVVEPFAGGAAYSMHHLGSLERIILVEKDPRVVETWQRVLAMTPEEVLSMTFPAAGERTSDFLYMTVATSNGIAGCSYVTVTPRMVEVVQGQMRTIATILTAAQATVEISLGDYREAPDLEATWFIDPPYAVGTRSSTGTSKPQGMGYRPGCKSRDLDYASLGQWCQTRAGQVIVCEHAGADWLPFEPLRESGDSQGRKAAEVVWSKDSQIQRIASELEQMRQTVEHLREAL